MASLVYERENCDDDISSYASSRLVATKMECGLALSVLLSITIFIITVVKMLWNHEGQPSESRTIFFTTISTLKKMFISERERERERELTRVALSYRRRQISQSDCEITSIFK